jgi:hypothetical protein
MLHPSACLNRHCAFLDDETVGCQVYGYFLGHTLNIRKVGFSVRPGRSPYADKN